MLLFMTICMQSFAQSTTRILASSGKVTSYKYSLYNPPNIIKPIYNRLDEVKNNTIEELMASVLCATSQDWVNYNTLGGVKNAITKTKEDFEQAKNRDKEKTSMELISRLNLVSNGQNFTIVRFRLHIEQAPKGVTGAYQLQMVENRWYQTSRSDLSNLALMTMFIKTDIMQDIIAGKPTRKPMTDELINKVYDKNGLNVETLFKEFSLWETDKLKTDYFTEPAW